MNKYVMLGLVLAAVVGAFFLGGKVFVSAPAVSIEYIGGAADAGAELMVCHNPDAGGMTCFEFGEFMRALQDMEGAQGGKEL